MCDMASQDSSKVFSLRPNNRRNSWNNTNTLNHNNYNRTLHPLFPYH